MAKILIVDDNVSFRQLLKGILSSHFSSFEIIEAGDGKEALEKVDSSCPSLVFMDIRLPGENGLELTKKIKADCPHIAVIILTSYDLPEYREAALRFGADSFVPKGSSTGEEIIALVKSFLGEKQ